MNDIHGTQYSIQEDPLRIKLLETCIDKGLDFGAAYGYLRPRWDWPGQEAYPDFLESKVRYETQLKNVLNNRKQVTNRGFPPRRVWDLYSNRVLPSWVPDMFKQSPPPLTSFAAVSHAWVKSLQSVKSPINSEEWSVPIPDDTTLDRIRIELLNYGLEYVWLDVLCLRQRGPKEMDETKEEEWAVDLPINGGVYTWATVIPTYYNGLGRSFEIIDLDGEKNWLNRVWTMQEGREYSVVVGLTDQSPCLFGEEGYQLEFSKRLRAATIRSNFFSRHRLFATLSQMKPRFSSYPLDQINGLAYLLQLDVLPAYNSGLKLEEAWKRLLEAMDGVFRGQLAFLYPVAGNNGFTWCPSWDQLTKLDLPQDDAVYDVINYDEFEDVYSYTTYQIDECKIEKGLKAATFEVTILGASAIAGIQFQIEHPEIASATPIPHGSYTLIGGQSLSFWMVGKRNNLGRVEKVSVARWSDASSLELRKKLEELIPQKNVVFA